LEESTSLKVIFKEDENMRIVVASDLHGKERAIQSLNRFLNSPASKIDLLIICGDITTFGNGKEARKILDSIETKVPMLAIPGNCDPPSVLRGIEESKAILLHKRGWKMDDHLFVGYGGAQTNETYGCTGPEAYTTLEKLVSGHPRKKVHLVFHAPAKGYLDNGLGNSIYRDFIEKYKPATVFSGHIHEAKGWTRNSYTFFLNPGTAAAGHFSVVEIQGLDVRVVADV